MSNVGQNRTWAKHTGAGKPRLQAIFAKVQRRANPEGMFQSVLGPELGCRRGGEAAALSVGTPRGPVGYPKSRIC